MLRATGKRWKWAAVRRGWGGKGEEAVLPIIIELVSSISCSLQEPRPPETASSSFEAPVVVVVASVFGVAVVAVVESCSSERLFRAVLCWPAE